MIAVALLSLLTAAAPASPRVSYEQPNSDPVAVKVMASYADCVVENDPKAAAALLEMDIRTKAYKDSMAAYARHHGSCVPNGGTLRFSDLLFAGDMAEALMRRHHVTADALAAAATASPSPAPGMARCVAEKQPREVYALFTTPHASDEERQALMAMKDSFPPCTPANQTAVFNIVGLRAMLALAAYHLVTDGAAPPAGK